MNSRWSEIEAIVRREKLLSFFPNTYAHARVGNMTSPSASCVKHLSVTVYL